MNDTNQPGSYIPLLVNSLAELVDRLRRFSSRETEPSPAYLPLADGPRLEVLADLLSQPDLRPRISPLDSLGPPLTALNQEINSVPGVNLGWLGPTIAQLSDTLEEVLRNLDAGAPPEELSCSPLWLGVLSRLDSCGTSREVMDDFDELCLRWEARWGEENLTAKEEDDLSRRWQTFREYGDAVFGNQESGPLSGPDRHGRILLLVAGRLQKDQLTRNLRTRGFEVLMESSPEDLLPLLATEPLPLGVVCDCQEPTNHLTRLRTLQENLDAPQNGWPPLILLGQGSGNVEVARGRARALTADGLWLEPYDKDPLSDLFSPS